MKVWEKIYLGTLILFLIIFNISTGYLFYLNYNRSLDGEKNTVINQWTTISEALEAELQLDEEVDIEATIHRYASKYKNRGIVIELYLRQEEGENVQAILEQSDLRWNVKEYDQYKKFISNVGAYTRTCIADYDNEKHIYIAGRVKGKNQEVYTLVIRNELTGFRGEWMQMILSVLGIQTIASIVLALCLFIFLRQILKPLNTLSEAADYMASGELEQQVLVRGRDEIAMVSSSFNHMAVKIADSMKELKEESIRKQQFIDDLAHEIRTPITTIQGYSQLLQTVNLAEEKRMQYLSYMIHESKRIHQMSEDLLRLSLVKQEEIVMEWFSNEILVRKVVEPLNHLAMATQINFVIEAEGKNYGSMSLLQNLLNNLVRNAINACETGGEITVIVREGQLCIKDTGIGMTKECLKNVYEPFYREDKSRSRSTFGVGLGMTICKQIISLHHGSIEIQSKKREGTTVNIQLPGSILTTS